MLKYPAICCDSLAFESCWLCWARRWNSKYFGHGQAFCKGTGDDFCCYQWRLHLQLLGYAEHSTNSILRGNLLPADTTFSRKKRSCIGNKQLFDDILKLRLYRQQAQVLIKTMNYWRDLSAKYSITYDSYKPNIFVEEAIYFHTQVFITEADNKQMCFDSGTAPASRALHFPIIFILKRCTSWPCATKRDTVSCMPKGGKGLQNISITSGDYKTL